MIYYIHIYRKTCVYIHFYVYTHVNMYIYMIIYVCICVYIHISTHNMYYNVKHSVSPWTADHHCKVRVDVSIATPIAGGCLTVWLPCELTGELDMERI